MVYSINPVISLQPFIENIWYSNRHVNKEEKTLTLPFGRMEMVIKFSGDYSIDYQEKVFEAKSFWITGQQIKPTLTTITGHHECMGVVFTLLGWNAFSKLRADELVNKFVPVPDLWGNEISSLRDELAEIKLVEAKFDRLQQFFSKKLLLNDKLSLIQEALDIIQVNGNEKKITVNSLSKQLRISRKSLNQHFQKYIGLPASAYLQQITFNNVIRDISNIRDERLIEVGYEYHFFDQAHFIKQFQSFSGMTPGQYLQLVKNNAVNKASPNFLRY